MLIRRDAISRYLASERRRDGVMLPCVLLALSGMMANPAKAVVATDTGGALEEIVVTAEKREETVGKVPISISVFNRDAMEQRNIQDIGDIAAISPGIDYQNTG